MFHVGIIGFGKMGISHCAILGTHPMIEKIVICDASKFLLSAIKQHSNFKCYSDYKKMSSDCKTKHRCVHEVTDSIPCAQIDAFKFRI